MGRPPEEDWKFDEAGKPVENEDDSAEAEFLIKFRLRGRDYEIDVLDFLDNAPFYEREVFEDAFDKPFAEIDLRRQKAILCFVYTAMRRAGQNVTLDDLMRMKDSDIEMVDDETGPTADPADEPAETAATG